MLVWVIVGSGGLFLLLLGLFIGWYLRDIRLRLIQLLGKVDNLHFEVPIKEEKKVPQTTFAEPMSPAELAMMEEQERIAKLNL